jgi:hypothetical protein
MADLLPYLKNLNRNPLLERYVGSPYQTSMSEAGESKVLYVVDTSTWLVCDEIPLTVPGQTHSPILFYLSFEKHSRVLLYDQSARCASRTCVCFARCTQKCNVSGGLSGAVWIPAQRANLSECILHLQMGRVASKRWAKGTSRRRRSTNSSR